MSMLGNLPLRDVHLPPAPPLWPPAPGWWMVAGGVLLALVVLCLWRWRKRRRRRAIELAFDQRLARAASPSEEVAALSELLRRAARRVDSGADRYEGEHWLAFLDNGAREPLFAGDCGRLLLEGGFRRDVSADAVQRLRQRARTRYLEWMSRR